MKKTVLIICILSFFSLHLSAQKYILKISSLKCYVTNAPFSDEIYITIDGKKATGILDFSAGKTINFTDGSFPFNGSVTVALYEEDYASNDDFLGTITVYGYESQKGVRTYNFTLDGADYVMTYEVFKNE